MRLLVITNACFKSESASGYCMENILLALTENTKVKVDVISFWKQDNIFQVNDNLRVLYRGNKIFKNSGLVKQNIQCIFNKITSELIDPDINVMYQKKVLRSVSQLIQENKYDAIISSMGGRSTGYAAYKIKKKYGLKWICILFDPFVKNNHLYKKNRVYYKRADRFDQVIKNDCDLIILEECIYNTINEKEIKSKVVKIGMPLVLAKEKREKSSNTIKSGIISIAFFGALYKNLRDPEYSISLLLKIPNVRLDFYGNSSTKQMISLYGEGRVCYRGVASHADIEKIVDSYDYLLNIGNATLNQVPSKIYEYITYKKPIINIVKNRDDPTIDVIKRYTYGISLVENEDGNIKKLESFISNDLKVPDDQMIADRFQMNSPYYAANIILKELSEGCH